MHRDDRHHVPAAALRGLERGDVAGASAFLARGGEVDARGPEEYFRCSTLLMVAADCGAEPTVAALLRLGADADLCDSAGATALMFAAANGHEPIVARLLDAGADVDLQDVVGRWKRVIGEAASPQEEFE